MNPFNILEVSLKLRLSLITFLFPIFPVFYNTLSITRFHSPDFRKFHHKNITTCWNVPFRPALVKGLHCHFILYQTLGFIIALPPQRDYRCPNYPKVFSQITLYKIIYLLWIYFVYLLLDMYFN